jgi:sugar/nucleoside kinase (ribokinase family)
MPASVVPDAWRAAPAWLLGPVAGELGDEWAGVPRDESLVAVGWQGLLRTIEPGAAVRRAPARPSALVRRADVIGLSRHDVDAATDLAGLCAFLRPGATLLVTGGQDGGLVVEARPEGPERLYRYPAVAPDRVVDPTGAGDVFLAAVLAARAQPRLVGGRIGQRYDLRLAAAVASLVVEGHGLAGVPDRAAIRRRLAEAGARAAAAAS